MRLALAIVLVAPALLGAQDIVVGRGAERNSGLFIREAVAQPHVIITGNGRLDLPRDSTVTSTLIVLGRDTYLASHVDGNVVVVGANLFLRPGVEVRGHAVAIGGTVASTTLGRVGGRIESYQDDIFDISPRPGGYALDYRPSVVARQIPLVQPAGIEGLMIPSYDRVDGLSLPLGVLLRAVDGMLEVEGSVTYRSRLGAFDPGATVRIAPERNVRFEGFVGIATRTNDSWNYSDLVNSATTFFAGNDTRNYFRSRIADGRLFALVERPGISFEPYLGGRFEKVSAITASGNVWSVTGRKDPDFEHIRRPNPFVEDGDISSGLIGAQLYDTAGTVVSRIRLGVEQSFTTMSRTTNFTQLTFDGRVDFPTFKTQHLYFRSHAVTTLGDSVPRARYAYLGGSGTLPVLDILEMGGTELFYLESRYAIPIESVKLPLIGSPIVTLRHIMGSAGVKSLPSLEQEIGIGLGLSALRFDFTHDVTGSRGSRFGAGISLSK
ncbi:MAG: hypothetical protein JWL61_1783 [Gemmatimonadetes bacterium]|nr:hypothetical protein [Gemmatimonadota bacterium]